MILRSKLPPRFPLPLSPSREGRGEIARRRLPLAFAGKGGRNLDHPSLPRLPSWPRRGRAIGILGGSFNPAHEGHRHISLLALKRLGLDEVWWLVSPQNPLKPVAGMAPFAERMASAQAMARHPRIKVTGIEATLGSNFTAETLVKLRDRLPRHRFVWLMGADNLTQVVSWRNWQQIFLTVVVAVLPRPSYCLRALAGKAAKRFGRWRLPEQASRLLPRRGPPDWVFLIGPRNPASATAIRARRRTTRSSDAATSKGRRQATGRAATTEG